MDFLIDLKKKIVLYFHNDPTTMLGSSNVADRIKLVKLCSRIVFNSNWSKKKFLTNFEFAASIFAKSQASASAIGVIPRYVIELIGFGGLLLLLLFLKVSSLLTQQIV